MNSHIREILQLIKRGHGPWFGYVFFFSGSKETYNHTQRFKRSKTKDSCIFIWIHVCFCIILLLLIIWHEFYVERKFWWSLSRTLKGLQIYHGKPKDIDRIISHKEAHGIKEDFKVQIFQGTKEKYFKVIRDKCLKVKELDGYVVLMLIL